MHMQRRVDRWNATYFDGRLSPDACQLLDGLEDAPAEACAFAERIFRLMRASRFDAADVSRLLAWDIGVVAPGILPSAWGGIVPPVTVADPDAVDGLRATLDDEARLKVAAALRQLGPRERAVLRLRYGIGHHRQHTLKEIADMLEISRERARQIERIARERLMATREVRSLGSGRNAGLDPT